MDKIGIILVNYKDYAKRFLSECRDSLREQSLPKEQFIVYIVDNASTEKTQKYLAENYPEAIVLARADGNYSAANNAGIARARQDGCDFFVVANMDTKFDPDWLKELLAAIKSDKKIAFAQSKILSYPKACLAHKCGDWNKLEDFQINSVGNSLNYLGFGYTNGYNEPAANYPDSNIQNIAGYVSGCSLITSKEVINALGGYNEEFYMYHDDIELCWRAKLAGYKLVLAPRSIVYHKYEFARSVRMLYYMERNRFIAIFSYYKLATLALILPAFVLLEIGMWLYSGINGWFITKIRVLLYFLRLDSWLKIWQTRKRVRELRKVTDREILQTLSGRIDFQEIDNWCLKYFGNPILDGYFRIVRKIINW